MKKVELAGGIYQYIFEPVADTLYGNNIIAVIRGNGAILIDAGYEFQTEEVKKDLASTNISIEGVIISHFHEGHIQGVKSLQGITVYGSSYYHHTLDQWVSAADRGYYIPTEKVDKTRKILFGEHMLELIHNPGHTLCTLLVKIDNRFLYVADELIYATEGEPVLPYLTKSDIINHYVSVHNLSKLINYCFIPGHGAMKCDQSDIIKDIKNICHYLCEILSNDEEIPVEQATRSCSCPFVHTERHENVYK
jgi:glyoxylase-like metal-dependent hydrolase (beta-lactamase superfamily II)